MDRKDKRYIVVKTYSEYDSGSPCAEIVEQKVCKTKEEAYALMKADYQTMASDCYDGDIAEFDKRRVHKCGQAYIHDCDGTVLWNIEEVYL